MSDYVWDKSLGRCCTICDPRSFFAVRRWATEQWKKKGGREKCPPCFQKKNKANLKVIERAAAAAAQEGAWKQVQRERFRLQRRSVGTLPLSLVLFINLFHPPRASSDPHSGQREARAFLPLLIPQRHTYCAHLYEAQSAQEHKGQRTTGRRFVFHSQSKSRGKSWV